MSIGDRLSNVTKKRLYQMVKPINKKREIDPKELADRQFRDTELMMGKYMDTFERKGGALRRR